MTSTDVRRRVAEIEKLADNPVMARAAERKLWEDVLRDIATSKSILRATLLAKEAIRTNDVLPPRSHV